MTKQEIKSDITKINKNITHLELTKQKIQEQCAQSGHDYEGFGGRIERCKWCDFIRVKES